MISSCIWEAFLGGHLARGYEEAFTPLKSLLSHEPKHEPSVTPIQEDETSRNA